MKRVWTLVLALMILCGSAVAEENWYVVEGSALVERMGTLVEDAEYRSIMGMPESVDNYVEKIAGLDYSKPASAWQLIIPDMETVLSLAADDDSMLGQIQKYVQKYLPEELLKGKMSDTAMEELSRRLPNVLVSQVNARLGGTEWLAAANVAMVSTTCQEPEKFQNSVVLLAYSEECLAAVNFVRTGENTVTITAIPLHPGVVKALKTNTASEICQALALLGWIQQVEVQ